MLKLQRIKPNQTTFSSRTTVRRLYRGFQTNEKKTTSYMNMIFYLDLMEFLWELILLLWTSSSAANTHTEVWMDPEQVSELSERRSQDPNWSAQSMRTAHTGAKFITHTHTWAELETDYQCNRVVELHQPAAAGSIWQSLTRITFSLCYAFLYTSTVEIWLN